MKVPNKISTLTELSNWFDKKNPSVIEISKNSELRKIQEFNLQETKRWKHYKGIVIKDII